MWIALLSVYLLRSSVLEECQFAPSRSKQVVDFLAVSAMSTLCLVNCMLDSHGVHLVLQDRKAELRSLLDR